MRDPLSSPVPKIFLYLIFLHIFVYSCEGIECLDIYMRSEDNLGETVHSYSVGLQETTQVVNLVANTFAGRVTLLASHCHFK